MKEIKRIHAWSGFGNGILFSLNQQIKNLPGQEPFQKSNNFGGKTINIGNNIGNLWRKKMIRNGKIGKTTVKIFFFYLGSRVNNSINNDNIGNFSCVSQFKMFLSCGIGFFQLIQFFGFFSIIFLQCRTLK